MQCKRKNSLQGFDVNKMVHIAMEKCFLGKMVYLTFCLTNSNTVKNNSQIQVNVLPTSKSNKFIKNSKIPELLANGICRIQNKEECRSVASIFRENVKHFERSVLSDRISDNSSVDDSSHSTENGVLIGNTDCDISDTVSPRNLVAASSDRNNFVLSMLSGDNEVDFSPDISLETVQNSVNCFELHGVETNISKSGTICDISNGNFTLSDLQQSVCRQSNINDSHLWTNVMEDKHSSSSFHENETLKDSTCFKSQSEKENQPKPASLPTSTANWTTGVQSYVVKPETTCGNDGSLEQNKAILKHSPNASAGKNEFDMLFDSPTWDDLDTFLADISLTRISKPELVSENQNESEYCEEDKRSFMGCDPSSDANVICSGQKSSTYFTSTPSLTDPCYQRTSDLESVTFSPICSVLISSPERNNEMLLRAVKRGSQVVLSSTPKPRKQKVSSKIWGDKKTKNLLKCALSSNKSTRCSNNSLLMSSVNLSQEKMNGFPLASSSALLTGDATPFEKWTDKSSLLFRDESSVNEAKEESIKPIRKLEDLLVNSLQSCGKLEDDKNTCTNRYIECSSNIFDECGSPLLFSPRTFSN